MFKVSAIGTEGHTIIARNTPSEALAKALELAGAGFANVRIADRSAYSIHRRPSSGSSSNERATTAMGPRTPRRHIRGPVQSDSREWTARHCRWPLGNGPTRPLLLRCVSRKLVLMV